jgi:hypothetical protein
MKFLVLSLIGLVSIAHATPTTRDLELIQHDAMHDLLITKNATQPIAHLMKAALVAPLNNGDCDDHSGVGSAYCWQQCSKEGYSSSTCASRCGVGTDGGARACWGACSTEGYSSSTCATRCGVESSVGSAYCWAGCQKEGYSSSTCAGRCGVSNDGGQRACWQQCQTEGYSSSTCATRCGIN